VLESVPGLIRVRLGGSGSVYNFRSRRLSWFGLGRQSGQIELVMRMQQADTERQNLLKIGVALRSLDGVSRHDPVWRDYCSQVFCDLRGYLMGQTGMVKEQAV